MKPKVALNPSPYDFVEVEWSDSQTHQGWEGLDEELQVPTCYSRGWKLKENGDGIMLVADLATEDGLVDSANRWMTIPRSMIRAVHVIEPAGTQRD